MEAPEVHQGLVELPGSPAPNREYPLGQRSESTLTRGTAGGLEAKDAAQDASDVRIDSGNALLVGEACNGTRRVSADAWKGLKGGWISRDGAAKVVDHRPGQAVQIAGTPIVAETIPGLTHCRLRCCSQSVDCGEAFGESSVVVTHPGHLRLLQHEFGHEDLVGVSGGSPWKTASLGPEPAKQAALELQRIRRDAATWHAAEDS